MKITSIDVMALKTRKPMLLKPIVCRVNTDEGIYGYGEAAVAFISGSNAAFQMIKDLGKMVIGMDPLENEVIWEKLYKESFWAQGNGVILFAAISAIDTALWDIKGKALNMPLYKLLGGKQRDSLRSYASQLQFGWKEPFTPKITDQDYVDVSLRAIQDGYDALKINFIKFDKDGNPISHLDTTSHLSRQLMKTAESRICAVREAIGPDVDLIIENHAQTDAATGIQFARMAEKYDIMFIEEVATPLNPQVMKRVADATTIPVSTGERTYTRWGFLPFFQNGSIALIQPDIGNCGGITEAKKICDMAHIFDVSVQAHVCSSPLSVATGIHLEASIPNFMIHEHHISNIDPSNIELFKYDYQPVNGYISIPELPGIGNELSEYALSTAIIETVK